MTRTRQASPAIILLALAVAGILVFGLVRWGLDARASRAAAALPPLTGEIDAAAASPGAMNHARLFQERVDGVVTISSAFGSTPMSGTGFVVDREGHILTASHVVVDYENTGEEADTIYVQFHAGDEVPAKLLGVDMFDDIAVLKVDPAEVTRLTPLPLGNSDKVATGAPVAAIGAPFGYEETLTQGIVSGTNRIIPSRINQGWQIPDAIQTDAPINPGNSGGPLFDARGQVIGINQQISSTAKQNSGVSFAVPINAAVWAMEQIKATGTVQYAWLGVNSVPVSPQMQREFGLAKPFGALVSQVSDNGPASRAGLSHEGPDRLFNGESVRLGDHVVELAGRKVRSTEDLMRITARLKVGEAVDMTFYRGGERQVVQVVPGVRST